MSYDLMVFEQTKAPTVYEEFLNWMSQQTEWSEDRDYHSIEGTSEQLVSWLMDMKKTFPPLNGAFRPSNEEIGTDQNMENHLTDYTIGTDLVYASFGYSVAEEADRLVPEYAKKHGVGFYNPQTGEVHHDDMIFCNMATEGQTDRISTWEQIEREILTLDSPQRGASNRDGAFVTLSFANNGTDQEFMQCMPVYPKEKGLFSKLFGGKQSVDGGIIAYTVEAGDGEKLYEKQATTKEELSAILHAYYIRRKLPDLSGWTDSGIL